MYAIWNDNFSKAIKVRAFLERVKGKGRSVVGNNGEEHFIDLNCTAGGWALTMGVSRFCLKGFLNLEIDILNSSLSLYMLTNWCIFCYL